ncbi:MAG: putative membrane protein [Limisphaerales bacterium]|jgi:uncharacterized membrane protein
MDIKTGLLLFTAMTSALIAGLFWAFTNSVMPGLAKVSDAAFVSTMQSINRVILNPIFFLCFLGTAITLPFSIFLEYKTGMSRRFWYITAATLLYLIGVMLVTMAGNVPLNNSLEAFTIDTAKEGALNQARSAFENRRNMLNNIRTISSVGACFFLMLALNTK